jgi:two-component system, chemotaxis family, CheB/CheR fusion protein
MTQTPPPERVLVVEDQDDVRESLLLLFSCRGYESRGAADGEEGLRLALAWRPEVVISDIGLPALDGWRLAEQVRRHLGGAGLLIALTGYALESDRRRSLQAGFDAHLAKPADPQVLLGLLARRAGERRGHPPQAGRQPLRVRVPSTVGGAVAEGRADCNGRVPGSR